MQFISDLNYLMDKYSLDKGYLREHAYGPIYNQYFSELNFKKTFKVLEIGIETWGSQILWKKYFPEANFYGFDHGNLKHLEEERIHIFQGKQENRSHLAQFIKEHGSNFDVIIDDGGHRMDEQQISFGFLFPHLKSGGLYICEDLFTSRSNWNYGVSNPTSLGMFEKLEQHLITDSQFMTDEEKEYINKNTASCKVERGCKSEIAFVKKRYSE